ncbi:MAG TPA: hypothetical protein VMV47_11910 [Bacteroidales bacterium]|nr:hypothetical protein [Bacteroidales bacterium]
MSKLMNKMVVIICFSLFSLNLFAPVSGGLAVEFTEPVNPFGKLIYAIGMVETKLDTLAYNPEEDAVGYFQIRPIRLRDYNERTGNRYRLTDMYNYDIAEEVFLYYASQIGPYNFEKIAKNWNGSGKKTRIYWSKVRKLL